MPVYFASDMHLRMDRPDRAQRLARWVDGLRPDDTLYLLGDICDFWYATRERQGDPLACEGLRALVDFRARGGTLTVLLGNHDLWLGPFYRSLFDPEIVAEPRIIDVHGLRFHLVHGHRTGGRQPWKSAMESRAFFEAFSRLPGYVARSLDRALEGSNGQDRERDEERLTEIYRQYADTLPPGIDIAVFGHVHAPVDDRRTAPRMIILGGWHRRSSYLRVDEEGAVLILDASATSVSA